jgi:hypothetical protein
MAGSKLTSCPDAAESYYLLRHEEPGPGTRGWQDNSGPTGSVELLCPG